MREAAALLAAFFDRVPEAPRRGRFAARKSAHNYRLCPCGGEMRHLFGT
jgi:hypothetical protein